jgi:hypothetical protein
MNTALSQAAQITRYRCFPASPSFEHTFLPLFSLSVCFVYDV